MGAPNILMIMTDQQRRDTLGAYGCSWIPTPNLDPLAASGTVFETCTVDDPVCTPSRASIFTGKPVPDHGVLGVHDNLPQTETLFTERLRREAGYRTALFGKLHVSSRVQEQRQRHPNDGFDIYEWCLEPSVSMDSPFNGYSRWLDETAPAFRDALARNGRRELHHPHDSHMSKWAADRTIDFLQTAKDDAQPFFCLMSLFDPHDPYEDYPIGFADRIDDATIPPPIPPHAHPPKCVQREQEGSYLGRFSDFAPDEIREIRKGYAASIAFLDRQIGRVLDALDHTGLADDTLVIFMSDTAISSAITGCSSKASRFTSRPSAYRLCCDGPAGRRQEGVLPRSFRDMILPPPACRRPSSIRHPAPRAKTSSKWRRQAAPAAAPQSAPTAILA